MVDTRLQELLDPTPEQLARMRKEWEKQWTPSSKKPPVSRSLSGRYLYDEDDEVCNQMPNSAWVIFGFLMVLLVGGSTFIKLVQYGII